MKYTEAIPRCTFQVHKPEEASERKAVHINKQHLYLKKFKIFDTGKVAKCYKLVVEGIFFDRKLKDLINLFRETQIEFKVKCEPYEMSILA